MYLKIIAIFLFCTNIVFAQTNLVSNGGFEELDTCDVGYSTLNHATGWFSPVICQGYPGGSSDLFNSCSNLSACSTPLNQVGYQVPHSGRGYAAVAIFSTQEYDLAREYIEVKLIDTLKTGIKYCVNFYVSLANDFNFGSTGMGAYLSTNILHQCDIEFSTLLFQPQVYASLTEPIMDTVNWVEVSGEFIAQGGELFLTIGNFFAGESIIFQQFNNIASRPFAYYLIDDVSVYECDTGIGINETTKSQLKIYVNNENELVFETTTPKAPDHLRLYNIQGQLVFVQKPYKNREVFYPNLSKGIYYWVYGEKSGKVAVW